MKIARVAVLGIAVGAAGGAAILAKSILPAEPTQAVQQAPAFKTEDVLVAGTDLGLGKRVAAGDLRWQAWPADSLSARYITRARKPNALTDIVNTIAREPLMEGEPVNLNKLVRSDQGGFMSAILPRGMRAISIRISPETGAGGFILPNDRVDVLLTREQSAQGSPGGAGGGFSSETVLTNVRILAIDQTFAEEDGRQVVVGKTATLELTPTQAEVMALGERRGELSLALRSLVDAGDDDGDGKLRRSGSVKVVKFGIATQITTSR